MSFHTFAIILSGAATIVTTLIALLLVFQHATHYSVPKEQKQIIRIAFFVPWVAIVAFLCVWLESAGLYLAPGIDVGTALALSSFLLLLCNFVLANPDGLRDLFGESANGGTSPPWLKKTWYMVLQFIPVSIILWIATVISLAVGTYCATSNKPYFVHIWIIVIKSICTILAVVSVLRFHGRMKSNLGPNSILLKLFAFKGVILVNLVQSVVISLLISCNAISPTKHLTYDNLKVALPNLLLACEMPFFAALVFYAYRVTPYKHSKTGKPLLRGSAGTAIIQALNYSDILSSFMRGPMRLIREQEKGRVRDSQDSAGLVLPPAYNNQANAYMNLEYQGNRV